MNAPTHKQCAENYRLWEEYVDPYGIDTEENFESLTVEEKIEMQITMFGLDE